MKKEFTKEEIDEKKRKLKEYHKKWRERVKENLTAEEMEEKKTKLSNYSKKYRKDNNNKINEVRREWAKNNPEKIKKYNTKNTLNRKDKKKIYDLENQERNREKQKEWRINNREYKNEKFKEYYASLTPEQKEERKNKQTKRQKERRKNDPLFRLKGNISSLIRFSFKIKNYQKESRTYEILGCSFEDFKIHLESQFLDWMNWSNYGNPEDGLFEPNKTWDIDHIIPLASATTDEEVIKLNHYTNLQPLCSYKNRFVKKHNY